MYEPADFYLTAVDQPREAVERSDIKGKLSSCIRRNTGTCFPPVLSKIFAMYKHISYCLWYVFSYSWNVLFFADRM